MRSISALRSWCSWVLLYEAMSGSWVVPVAANQAAKKASEGARVTLNLEGWSYAPAGGNVGPEWEKSRWVLCGQVR